MTPKASPRTRSFPLWLLLPVVLVILAALVELILDGRTFDGGLELYLVSWAVVLYGLRWLFDSAEYSASHEERSALAGTIRSGGLWAGFRDTPKHFLAFFDRGLGNRPSALKRASRLALLSAVAVLAMASAWASTSFPKDVWCKAAPAVAGAEGSAGRSSWECAFPADPDEARGLEHGISRFFTLDRAPDDDRDRVLVGHREIHLGSTLLRGTLLFLLFVALNGIHDLISFCQTRLLARLGARWRLPVSTLLLDGFLTLMISGGILLGSMRLGWLPPTPKNSLFVTVSGSSFLDETLTLKPAVRRLKVPAVSTAFQPSGNLSLAATDGRAGGERGEAGLSWHVRSDEKLGWGLPPGIAFYTAFAASGLLWLFVLGWLLARIRVRAMGTRGSSGRPPPGLGEPFRFVGGNVLWLVTAGFLVGVFFVL